MIKIKPQKWLIAISIILLTATYTALASAPYLPRLLHETYPKFSWPAPGSFSKLSGIPADHQTDRKISTLPQRSKLDNWSQQLFDERSGKALIIWQGGTFKKSHFAPGITAEHRFNSYSMAKSLIGVLVLKALAEKKFISATQPLHHFWPELIEKTIGSVTIDKLLTMRSGIKAEKNLDKRKPIAETSKNMDISRFNPFGTMVRLHMSGLENVLPSLEINPAYRGVFQYQNVNTAILGALLEKVYQEPLEQILSEKIWQPAGAGTAPWRRYGKNKPVTPYCCIYARPVDWVKIGLFLMRNGVEDKNQQRFLPHALWNRLMGAGFSDAQVKQGSKYGPHVYHNILDRKGEPLQGRFTYLFGSRGQVVYIMPEKELVVVRFGQGIQKLHSTLYAASRNF